MSQQSFGVPEKLGEKQIGYQSLGTMKNNFTEELDKIMMYQKDQLKRNQEIKAQFVESIKKFLDESIDKQLLYNTNRSLTNVYWNDN